jgi:glycosyltransferase involved in cell wall biosynthesis
VRVLFLTPDAPVPADQGAKIRNLALIRAAASRHQVDLVTFARGGSLPQEHLDFLRGLCRRVEVVEAPGPRPALIRAWALLFDPLPDLAYRLESRLYRQALADVLQRQRYDVVQIEGLEMMPFLALARSGADRGGVIYDAHNAEMSLQRSIFQVEFRDPARWLAGLYSLTQWSKLGTYERVMMNETHMVLAVSEPDAGKLHGRHVEPELVPNGVDTSQIPFRGAGPAGQRFLFIGPLDYRPNADAVRWLVRAIWPRILAKLPDARLRLVGRGAERIAGPNVEAVGYVDEVGENLGRADALIVPMRMGAGVRFKVLEAMAAGVPVVSTSVGLSGIAAEHERHALVANSAEDLASAAVRVVEDRALGRRLAREARGLVEARYDWKKITPNYLRLLNVAQQRGRR